MDYMRRLFNRYNIKMYQDDIEIDFKTLNKLETIDLERQKSESRCKGYYKSSGIRCKTKLHGGQEYCSSHRDQRVEEYELPKVETIMYDPPSQCNLEQIVIDNKIYYLDRSTNELYKDDHYAGQYDSTTTTRIVQQA